MLKLDNPSRITLGSVFFCAFGEHWRPQAGNSNISLGLLMVWRGPQRLKSHKTQKPMFSTDFLFFAVNLVNST